MPLIRLQTRVLGDDLFVFAQYDTSITWDAAAQAARDFDASGDDGHLATITSQEQADFIGAVAATMPGYFVGLSGPWIGLSRETVESAFEWITGEPVEFTNWSPSEPNNYNGLGERWVQILSGLGQWNDNVQGGNEPQNGYIGEESAAAANVITGSTGDDVIELGGGNDRALAGGGADSLSGGSGNDRLFGRQGNDTLTGDSGRDRLAGGKGDDQLDGGTGADSIVFRLGDGNDTVALFDAAEDRLLLSTDLWAGILTEQQVVDAFATDTGTGALLSFGGDSIFLTGADLATLAAAIEFI